MAYRLSIRVMSAFYYFQVFKMPPENILSLKTEGIKKRLFKYFMNFDFWKINEEGLSLTDHVKKVA